jgi:hypothetical protein
MTGRGPLSSGPGSATVRRTAPDEAPADAEVPDVEVPDVEVPDVADRATARAFGHAH